MCVLDVGEGFEATLSRTTQPRAPYVFAVERGQDPGAIAKALIAAHPDCIVRPINENTLSVVLPPSINVGTDPVDIRKVAFSLAARRAVEDLGLEGQLEVCCGNGGGCCAN